MGHGDRSWGLMSMGMHAHFRYAHVWEAHGCMCVRAWFIEDINPLCTSATCKDNTGPS